MNTKSGLIIRLIAGMYLFYLAYELFMGLGENISDGAPKGVSVAVAVIFVIFGFIFVFFSGRDFLNGNYQGGIMDTKEEKNTTENR